MINICHLLDTINIIPHDDTLYLLERLSCGTGLFASNGDIIYLVPNAEHSTSLSIITEFLHLQTNVFVSAFNETSASFENGYYNTITLKLPQLNESVENLKAFANLCLAHSTYMKGQELMVFFDSLVSLFQLPREQHYKNLIGLMGELLFIEFIHNTYGVDLSIYWHSEGSSSRFDFVCPFANFEVKTTSNDSLLFTIKHDQLFASNTNNYLVAVVISESNIGRTLNDLISDMLTNSNYCNSLQFSVNIEKEKRRISPSELYNKHFIFKKVYAYNTKEINQFKTLPDCIEDLSYKLNLLPFSDVAFADIIPSLQDKS